MLTQIVSPPASGQMSACKIVALFGIVIMIGVVGFLIGRNNHIFLTCEDFKVSGNALPARCAAR